DSRPRTNGGSRAPGPRSTGSRDPGTRTRRGFRRACKGRSTARAHGPQGRARAHAAGGEARGPGHRVPGRTSRRGPALERPANRNRRPAGARHDQTASRGKARTDPAAMAAPAGKRQSQCRLQGPQRRWRRGGQTGRATGVARRPLAGPQRRPGSGGMRAAPRIPLAIAGLVLMAWLAWTIIQVTRADALAETDPQAALRIDPDHPQALLRLAWRQLGDDQVDQAMATARHLLSVEPGQGDAFAVLAL